MAIHGDSPRRGIPGAAEITRKRRRQTVSGKSDQERVLPVAQFPLRGVQCRKIFGFRRSRSEKASAPVEREPSEPLIFLAAENHRLKSAWAFGIDVHDVRV